MEDWKDEGWSDTRQGVMRDWKIKGMLVGVPSGTIVSIISGINALLPRLTSNNAEGVLSRWLR